MTTNDAPPGPGAPLRLEDFDYELPEERIAQRPADARDASRLLLLDRERGGTEHRAFRELPEILRPGDLLVLNDARVWPARLKGRKETGGAVEALLLEALLTGYREELWEALVRGIKLGQTVRFGEEIEGVAEEELGGGKVLLRLRAPGRLARRREAAGEVPLPPYIHRDGPPGEEDRERYQTVYARVPGAIAAPTAGLHFTDEVLAAIRERGIETAWVTLLVGYGTFQPVRAEDAREHRLDAESYKIPSETVEAIRDARARNGRVVAVGTTVVRTLEGAALQDGTVEGGEGKTDLMVLPGHEFRVVDALLTNFHLPRSSLLLLVSAFAGRENILSAYEEAVREGYRFYSYGDAMLIS